MSDFRAQQIKRWHQREKPRVDPTLTHHGFSESWVNERPRMCATCEACGRVFEVGPGVIKHWAMHHPLQWLWGMALRGLARTIEASRGAR